MVPRVTVYTNFENFTCFMLKDRMNLTFVKKQQQQQQQQQKKKERK